MRRRKTHLIILQRTVVAESATVLELLASEDHTLLIWWDAFLVHDFCFDIFDGIGWLDIESDGLARKSFGEDLHGVIVSMTRMV